MPSAAKIYFATKHVPITSPKLDGHDGQIDREILGKDAKIGVIND